MTYRPQADLPADRDGIFRENADRLPRHLSAACVLRYQTLREWGYCPTHRRAADSGLVTVVFCAVVCPLQNLNSVCSNRLGKGRLCGCNRRSTFTTIIVQTFVEISATAPSDAPKCDRVSVRLACASVTLLQSSLRQPAFLPHLTKVRLGRFLAHTISLADREGEEQVRGWTPAVHLTSSPVVRGTGLFLFIIFATQVRQYKVLCHRLNILCQSPPP